MNFLDNEVSHWRGFVYRLVLCSLFGIGFLITTVWLRPKLPNDHEIAGKLAFLTESDSNYDCVIIGSSRLNRGVNPSVLDTSLGEYGYLKNSFNLSVPGLRAYEAACMVGQVKRLPPRKRPSWLIVEVTDCYPPISTGMAGTDRSIHWNTASNAWNSVRVILQDYDAAPVERLKQLQLVADAFLARSINHGRLIHKIPSSKPKRKIDQRIFDNDGFLSLDDENSPNAAARRKSFLNEHMRFYKRSLSRMNAQNAARETASNALREFYFALDQEIRVAGIQPIYVVPNIRWGTPNLHSLGEEQVLCPLFSYNFLDRYPRFYEVATRWDKGHMNAVGAQEFSATLARDIANFLNAQSTSASIAVPHKGFPFAATDESQTANAANEPQ